MGFKTQHFYSNNKQLTKTIFLFQLNKLLIQQYKDIIFDRVDNVVNEIEISTVGSHEAIDVHYVS